MNSELNRVTIYTDGACKGNPGPGGWGALLRFKDAEKSLFGGEADTTNNRMELMAAIQGLSALTKTCSVDLFTDSKYVMNGINDWMPNWKRKGWKTSANKPVKNIELWQKLDDEVSRHDIRWHWVKGHSGHPGNEMADQLANQGVASLSA